MGAPAPDDTGREPIDFYGISQTVLGEREIGITGEETAR